MVIRIVETKDKKKLSSFFASSLCIGVDMTILVNVICDLPPETKIPKINDERSILSLSMILCQVSEHATQII